MSTCMLAMKRPARIVKTMTITTTEACGTCLERVHVHPTKLPWPHLLLKFAAGACNRMKPNLYAWPEPQHHVPHPVPQNGTLCHAHTQPQSRFGSSCAFRFQAVVYNNALWPAADAYLVSLDGSTPRPLLSFFVAPRGAHPPPAGPTQLSQVTPTAGGLRLSPIDEGRLTHLISRRCPAPGPNSHGSRIHVSGKPGAPTPDTH